jgi:hypothetical protein
MEANQELLPTAQMSMRKGIKEFGSAGVEAVKAELQQLHDRVVMQPKSPKELTPAQKKEALAYLMFLKRKRGGKVKGRGCADGRKQRGLVDKEDTTSPTIATEAVFLLAVTAAYEGRDIAFMDVPGAFMQADMDRLVHVRFTGRMVDLLLEVDPEMYGPHVTYEGKERVLYAELLKALYGTLMAARLFWKKLCCKLQEWGFVPNPYCDCVMNKIVNGKQCTVGWHVDDLMLSHMETSVVSQIIQMMNDEFGREVPLTVSRGSVHEYLGMKFDFSTKGEVIIDMIDYIKTIMSEIPEDMIGSAATPAAGHLFEVRPHPVKLDKQTSDVFRRIVMQLLYLSQRARPDIRTAVSFLSKRIQVPDEDDYKKLTRVIKYLQSTTDLKLRLAGDGSGRVRWWVDASYAVHPDMKGHTGATMSMGSGSIYSTSSGQKLVARSSTESELIGVHDAMPQVIWTSHFLKAQGQTVVENVVYQDNKSSLLLEKNGRQSCGKRTRHIDIRYFFIKDRVSQGEVCLEYCPTEDMLADFFTKPLQGNLFYKFRDRIMNIDSNSPYHSSHRSVLKVVIPNSKDNEVSKDNDSKDNEVSKDNDVVKLDGQEAVRSYKEVLLGELS